jgi:hypothetical protein
MFRVDQTQVGVLHLLVLLIGRPALDKILTVVECVEMNPVYAQTSVVVHGRPQLLACTKVVTCLTTSRQPQSHMVCGQRNYILFVHSSRAGLQEILSAVEQRVYREHGRV